MRELNGITRLIDPPVNQTFSANTYTRGTAGAVVTIMNLICLQSDGKWDPADADVESLTDGLLGFAASSGVDTTILNVMLPVCIVRDDTWNFTPGGAIYVSTVAGGVTQTAPPAAGDFVRKIGYAIDVDAFMFLPEATTLEVA